MKITSHIKLKNPKNKIIYDSEHKSEYDDLFRLLAIINDQSNYFIIVKFKPLDETFTDNDLYDSGHDIETLVNFNLSININTGFVISLQDGHLELNILNSQSKSTYYIYGLNEVGEDIFDAWDSKELSDKQFSQKLLSKGIQEIEID